MSVELQVFLTVAAVIAGVASLGRAVVVLERREHLEAAFFAALFVGAFVAVLWAGFRPVHQPTGCQTYVQTVWVDGIETTRCMPESGQRGQR